MKRLAIAAAALCASISTQASAVLFASFSDSDLNFHYTAGATRTITNQESPELVSFNFLTLGGFDPGSLTAQLVYTGVTSTDSPPANGSGGYNSLTQPPSGQFTGKISFLSTSAFSVGSNNYGVGTNLLTLDFTGGVLSRNGGNPGTFQRSGGVIFTSDVLGFGPAGAADSFVFNISGFTPSGGSGSFFDALATVGTFNSDSVQSVPEASAWAMMILGFGALGSIERSARRRKAAAAIA